MHCYDWVRWYRYRDIINDALNAPPSKRRRTTNLYLDTVPHAQGSFIGPEFQEIRARQRCLLVFADDDPLANFGHPCRYRFYDEKTHAFLYEVAARFPPYLRAVPSTFRVFHEAVRAVRTRLRTPLEIIPVPTPIPTPTPAPVPIARERYAILFSGSSERRHLNDLEYCYRMLTTRYQFKAANICVLNFDNTRSLREGGVANNWPAETSASDPTRSRFRRCPCRRPLLRRASRCCCQSRSRRVPACVSADCCKAAAAGSGVHPHQWSRRCSATGQPTANSMAGTTG